MFQAFFSTSTAGFAQPHLRGCWVSTVKRFVCQSALHHCLYNLVSTKADRETNFKMSAITPSQVKAKIEAGIPDAQVQVMDLTGTGDHYKAVVISAAFAGKSLVQQHQLVYGCVRAEMASEAIHALALETHTPEAWKVANP
jgi:stress-induced morphogen